MNVAQIAKAAAVQERAHKHGCKVRPFGITCSLHERLKKIRVAAEVLIENELWIRLVVLREQLPPSCGHAACAPTLCAIADAVRHDASVA